LLGELIGVQFAWSLNASAASPRSLLAVTASVPWQIDVINENRLNLARNYHLMGEIYFRVNDRQRSRLYYDKCVAVREELLKAYQEDYRLKGDLGQLHWYYGDMLVRLAAPPKEALAHYDRAIELLKSVAALDKSIEFKQNLGKTCFARGVAALRMNDRADAEKYFEQCLKIQQELLDADPINSEKQANLMLSYPIKASTNAPLCWPSRWQRQEKETWDSCSKSAAATPSALPRQPATPLCARNMKGNP
jgi:tetratricopeptide (TPR) repeat protein